MNVKNGLPALFSEIRDDPKTFFQPELGNKALYRLVNGNKDFPIDCVFLEKGGNVNFRNDEQMDGGLWIDIFKNHDIFVLEENFRRDFPLDYFAKDTIFHCFKVKVYLT